MASTEKSRCPAQPVASASARSGGPLVLLVIGKSLVFLVCNGPDPSASKAFHTHRTNQGQDGRQVQAKKSLLFLSEKLIRELLNSFSLDLLRNAVSLLCRHNALGGLEARSLVLRHKSDESDEWTSLDSSL